MSEARPLYPPLEKQLEIAGKVRCLDKFFAECLEGKHGIAVGEWDLNFIISVKDQIDNKNKSMTNKQVHTIDKIFNLYEGMDHTFDFEWEKHVHN